MAYEESLRSISLDADSSLAGYTGVPNQPGSAVPNYGKALYRFCKITGTHQVGRAGSDDVADVVGVVQNKPQVVGQAATVGIRGVTNLLAGAKVEPGQHVVPDDEGRAVPADEGTQGLAIAITAAGGEGEVFSGLLRVI